MESPFEVKSWNQLLNFRFVRDTDGSGESEDSINTIFEPEDRAEMPDEEQATEAPPVATKAVTTPETITQSKLFFKGFTKPLSWFTVPKINYFNYKYSFT